VFVRLLFCVRVGGGGRVPCVAVSVVALAVSLWCLRSWKLVGLLWLIYTVWTFEAEVLES
jgi:hypothetical protein